MTLKEALQIEPGVTAFVGGGGKTHTIYQVAQELEVMGKKVIVTTTTKMFVPTTEEAAVVLYNPSRRVAEKAFEKYGKIVIGETSKQGKLQGISASQIETLEQWADYILVEADGARRLPVKVPEIHEPVIPKNAQHVIALMGLSALEQPIEEVCFRHTAAMRQLAVSQNHRLGIEDLWQMAVSEWGLRKDVDHRYFTVFFNQVDVLSEAETLAVRRHLISKTWTDGSLIIGSVQQNIWHTLHEQGDSLC